MKITGMLTAAALIMATSGPALSTETLKILTWTGYAPKALIEKFEKQTGIKVEPTYSNNEEMIAKLRATRGSGFDLIQPSQDRISSVQDKYKIYQAIDYSKIESDQIITSMLEAVKKNTKVKGKSYAVPFCYGTSGLVVNTKKAPYARDYDALLNPAYSGRISYRLKRPTLIAMAFAKGDDPFEKYSDVKAYSELMNGVGADLMSGKGLVKNYYANGDALLELMRSGEVNVAMAWDNGGWKLHDENPDIDFVAPKSGALGWIDTFAIPAKAKNVDGAYKWINFMLKAENAAYFTNQEKYGTASKGAAKHLDAKIRENFSRSFSSADIDNINWYPPVPAKLESIEGKILDKVKASN
ncbi:MAG: extracellular solute-binding protein [Gammaproteobacteria bacterium]|jgi:spermidine/putrescine transport system substrate-binding protein|nr:extracellular solute-binding protein [Gammaproteobacteria bacterium]MBT3722364.1 extracellular solute-binding protein [Gammaproteobacteria bacterium]MBT4075326.1 extracellular solute-binding protein [Gammaproteobacteria bacterium]MBT4193250.1 extracellular solute-binding protein [Gammaproteobacteria bacterium]MBT4450937.1 extracellular solute-binding protein [Gammaproteobacteria bacterium]